MTKKYILKNNKETIKLTSFNEVMEFFKLTEHYARLGVNKGQIEDYTVTVESTSPPIDKGKLELFILNTYRKLDKKESITRICNMFGLTRKEANRRRNAAVTKLKNEGRITAKERKLPKLDQHYLEMAIQDDTPRVVERKVYEPMQYAGEDGYVWVHTENITTKNAKLTV